MMCRVCFMLLFVSALILFSGCSSDGSSDSDPGSQDSPVDLTELEIIEFNGIEVYHTSKMYDADKVLFFFHGAGGSSSNVVQKEDYLETIGIAVNMGCYVVVPESSDRVEKKWDGADISDANPDLQNFDGILSLLESEGHISPDAYLFVSGHSNGCSFTAICSYVRDIVSASMNNASGLETLYEQPDFITPVVFTYGELEGTEREDDTLAARDILIQKGIRTAVYENAGCDHPFSSLHSYEVLSFLMTCYKEPSFYMVAQGPAEKDEIDGVTVDADGYTYVAGDMIDTMMIAGTERTSLGYRDIYVIKLDKEGNEVWFKTFATEDDETIFDLTTDNNGSLVINGMQGYGPQTVDGNEFYKTLTIKINAESNEEVWRKSWNDGGGNEVIADSARNIYATYISDTGITIDDVVYKGAGSQRWAYVVKLLPNGDVDWVFNTTSQYPERIRAIAVGCDDTRIIAGFEYWGGIGIGEDIYPLDVINADSKGAYIILDETGEIVDFQILETTGAANVRGAGGYSGGLYMNGFFEGDAVLNGETFSSPGPAGSFVVKLDSEGSLDWIRVMGNPGNDESGEMAVTDLGDAYVTGTYQGETYSLYDETGSWMADMLEPVLNRTAYWVQLTPEGEYSQSFAVNQISGSSAGGVIEICNNQMVVNVRLKGEMEILGESIDSGLGSELKDAAILKFGY